MRYEQTAQTCGLCEATGTNLDSGAGDQMTLNDAKTSAGGTVAIVPFELVSIDATAAPNGGAGDDWLVYRIAQGPNQVTGYRCGSRAHVLAEVERIVIALNERLHVRGRSYHSTKRSLKLPPTQHKDLR